MHSPGIKLHKRIVVNERSDEYTNMEQRVGVKPVIKCTGRESFRNMKYIQHCSSTVSSKSSKNGKQNSLDLGHVAFNYKQMDSRDYTRDGNAGQYK